MRKYGVGSGYSLTYVFLSMSLTTLTTTDLPRLETIIFWNSFLAITFRAACYVRQYIVVFSIFF